MRLIPILILSIFLTGCTIFKKTEVPVVEPTKVLNIDPKLLQPCQLLSTTTLASFDDVVNAYSDLAIKYVNCANKQQDAALLIKEFGNIK